MALYLNEKEYNVRFGSKIKTINLGVPNKDIILATVNNQDLTTSTGLVLITKKKEDE